jgi:hypothetical protein
MPAGKLNLYIEKGATYRQRFLYATGNPLEYVDLSMYTARMMIRAPGTIGGGAGGNVLIELTTENDRITLNAEPGSIDLFINATDTTALLGIAGLYDIELVNADEVIRLLEGEVKISPEVTRT